MLLNRKSTPYFKYNSNSYWREKSKSLRQPKQACTISINNNDNKQGMKILTSYQAFHQQVIQISYISELIVILNSIVRIVHELSTKSIEKPEIFSLYTISWTSSHFTNTTSVPFRLVDRGFITSKSCSLNENRRILCTCKRSFTFLWHLF